MTPSGQPDLRLKVDLTLFSVEAVKAACYELADRAVAALTRTSDTELDVAFTLAEAADCEAVRVSFLRALVDEDLRERIGRETEAVRNLIIAHALSRVPLLHADEEAADYK